jgi:hypothetical protein
MARHYALCLSWLSGLCPALSFVLPFASYGLLAGGMLSGASLGCGRGPGVAPSNTTLNSVGLPEVTSTD